MKKILISYAFIALFIFSKNVFAEKMGVLPFFDYLGTNAENVSLSMDCEGVNPYDQVHCKFIQISLIKNNASEDKLGLEKLKKEIGEIDFNKETMQVCSPLENRVRQFEIDKITMSKGRANFLQNELNILSETCHCYQTKDKDCVLNSFKKIQNSENNTCQVYHRTFELDFKRISDNKWINASEPYGGLCGNITEITIEHEPNNPNLWTFTQFNIAKRDSESKFCKDPKGYEWKGKVLFSWKMPKGVQIDCNNVKFNK